MQETAFMPVQPLEQTDYTGLHRAEEEAAHAGWRARLGQIAGRTALVLGLAAGTTGALAATESTRAEAASVSCYGDYCSGQYANETGCDQDAETLDTASISGVEYRWNAGLSSDNVGFESHDAEITLGSIELRYSPTCKTKWARMTTKHNSDISHVSVMQDTGYKQSRHVDAFWKGIPPSRATSPMIYSPNNDVHAYVEGDNLVNLSTDWK
jgi:hypothetical protein